MGFQIKPRFLVFVFLSLLFQLHLVYADGHWLDLPPDPLNTILYEYDPKLDSLNALVQNYHAIHKNTWESIPERVIYLDKIENYSTELSKQLKNEYLRRIAVKYASLANHKKSYLISLQNLKSNYENVKYEIFNPNTIPTEYTPLKLNNERKLDFKTQEFWGQYFIEAIDPCHRRLLNSYHEIWEKKHPNKELPDFFLWLEDKNVSLFFPSILLFTPEELETYKVKIKNGMFYSTEDNLITTKVVQDTSMFKSEPIFIIDSNEDMYIAYSGNQHAHVSLSHYKPLIGSGKIWVEQGIIRKISFESGHYLPQIPHFVQALNFWEERGVKIEENVELVYYEGYEEKQTTIRQFKERYLSNQRRS